MWMNCRKVEKFVFLPDVYAELLNKTNNLSIINTEIDLSEGMLPLMLRNVFRTVIDMEFGAQRSLCARSSGSYRGSSAHSSTPTRASSKHK